MLRQLFSWVCVAGAVLGLDLTPGDRDSVCDAATLITNGIMDYYEGSRYGGTVGMFQPPYYWWEAGLVFGGMIDTWYLCENDTYQDLLVDVILAQKGDDNTFIPQNQSLTEGNDDQGFWAFVAMGAAERNFTNPPDDNPGWLAMAQGAYNTMWSRWDSDTCGGGVRWQIFTWNSGYDYKNTISNACIFNMAARLARYTRNDTYARSAATVWDWLTTSGFVVLNGDSYSVYDGAKIEGNCSTMSSQEWTYNFGVLLMGASYMYNYTEDQEWETAVSHLLSGMSIFLNDNVLFERQCQTSRTCNNDQLSFRSITARGLGAAARLVPSVSDQVMEILDASARGAASSCSGGSDGHTCGVDWSSGSWDNLWGLGEQIAALEVIQNTLILDMPGPNDNSTGSSEGNVNEGLDSQDVTNPHKITVTHRDKAGAAVLTIVVLGVVVGLGAFMVI